MPVKISALERLKSAASLTLTKQTVELTNGEEFEFYCTPLTMAERMRPNKMTGSSNPDASEFALCLVIIKAKDEAGQPMFSAGQVDELRNEVADADLQKLMLKVMGAEIPASSEEGKN